MPPCPIFSFICGASLLARNHEKIAASALAASGSGINLFKNAVCWSGAQTSRYTE
jgi:hypothetical protein